MKYVIDKEKRPVYLQIYSKIREDIVNGIYLYNEKLPSKRILAEETGVSTLTVEHAYALLCDEGYAEARERSGYIVTFRKNDGFAVATKIEHKYHTQKNTVHAYPDLPISVLSKTMRSVLCEHGDLLLEKTEGKGCSELREAIRRYLARNRGMQVEAEQIVVGAGAEYLYGLIIALLGRGRTYAIESPSYPKIEEVYRAAEIRYGLLPLTKEGIESRALSESTADVLHTTPYRSYPSGVTASASKRHEYVRWASEGTRYIIEDDYESEFSISTKPAETLFSLSKKDNVIYLNTFTKTISPALRVGYMVLPKHLVAEYEEKLGFYSCTVSTFMQFVLTELIDGGDFERHINRVRRSIRRSLIKNEEASK